jgi:hypothetical protein
MRGWRPPDTMYLSLQEALQVGEGSAIQEGSAGHFECSLVQNWKLYSDGSQEFTVKIDEEMHLVDFVPQEDTDKEEFSREIVASGTVGYMVTIFSDEQEVDTIVGSYEEAVTLLESAHPDLNRWEPGWQADNILCVARLLDGPLHIEYHGQDDDMEQSLLSLESNELGIPSIAYSASSKPFGIQIEVVPNGEETIWQVATSLAQRLNITLEEHIYEYEEDEEIEE